MTMQKRETREKILTETKRLIREAGIGNITTRRIASEAGVNIASINYHFGSKDALLFQAMGDVTEKLREALTVMENDEMEKLERVKVYLKQLARIIVENPEIPASLLKTFASDKKLPDRLKGFIEGFYKRFKTFLVEEIGVENPRRATMIIEQIISAIWFPVFSYRNIAGILEIDFMDEAVREEYIDALVENMLRRYSDGTA